MRKKKTRLDQMARVYLPLQNGFVNRCVCVCVCERDIDARNCCVVGGGFVVTDLVHLFCFLKLNITVKRLGATVCGRCAVEQLGIVINNY